MYSHSIVKILSKNIYLTVYTLACVLNTLKSDVTQMFSAFSWIEANMYSVLNSTINLDTSLNTYFSAILET